MSRRRRAAAAFSLFSFQDIITSVTAILILMVLILALELLTRRQDAAAADPSVSRASLRDAAAVLEALVAKLSAVVPSDELRPFVRRTRSELERDVRVVEDQARQAAADAETARAVEGRARALAAAAIARLEEVQEIREEVDRMKDLAAKVAEEASKLALENEQEADRLAQKREQMVEQPSPGTQLVFNAPNDFDTQAWIVEVSSDGLTVVKLGTNKRQSLGASTGPGTASSDWLSKLKSGRDHALILVRPSGVDRVEFIRSGLAAAGISFGIDFIGEDQAVRDGVGEANADQAGEDKP
jgi:regulator of replication initiation timing